MATISLQAIFLFLAFTFSIFLIYNKKKRISASQMLPTKPSLPPGPKAWPIIGSLFVLMRNKPFFRWVYDTMSKMGHEIFCIRIGNTHVIIVSSPEIACEIFKKQDAIFASRPTFLSSELVSNGFSTTVFMNIGDQWKKMKRVLATHILSPATLKWMHDRRAEETNHLVRYVHNVINSNEVGGVNIRVASQHFCGNMMRNMIFSKRFFGKGAENGGPGVEEEEHMAGIFDILKCLFNFCISDYFMFLRRRMDLEWNEKFTRQAVASVRKYQDPEIDTRIKQWQTGTKTKINDLLDVLITLKDDEGNNLLTTEVIKTQVLEMMAASIDNPSNAIEWTLGEMINQPKTLVRAVQELDQVVGKNRLVLESDLNNLNYIKACVKESFRLHPITAFNIPHVSMYDTMVAGYFIPKDSHVILSRQGLGLNSRIWDEPLRFNPERHLIQHDASNVILVDPDLRLFSFGIGRRGCPAVNLGSTMAVMLLASLLQGFTWSPPPKATCIELVEATDEMALSKPLLAYARPRLDERLYASLNP